MCHFMLDAHKHLKYLKYSMDLARYNKVSYTCVIYVRKHVWEVSLGHWDEENGIGWFAGVKVLLGMEVSVEATNVEGEG